MSLESMITGSFRDPASAYQPSDEELLPLKTCAVGTLVGDEPPISFQ